MGKAMHLDANSSSAMNGLAAQKAPSVSANALRARLPPA